MPLKIHATPGNPIPATFEWGPHDAEVLRLLMDPEFAWGGADRDYIRLAVLEAVNRMERFEKERDEARRKYCMLQEYVSPDMCSADPPTAYECAKATYGKEVADSLFPADQETTSEET